jgi:hypothetical protein
MITARLQSRTIGAAARWFSSRSRTEEQYVANSRISVGDDTASGEPANGPKGPYITDDSDDEMRNAAKPDAKKDIASTGAPDGTGRQGTASTQGDGWRQRAERQEAKD